MLLTLKTFNNFPGAVVLQRSNKSRKKYFILTLVSPVLLMIVVDHNRTNRFSSRLKFNSQAKNEVRSVLNPNILTLNSPRCSIGRTCLSHAYNEKTDIPDVAMYEVNTAMETALST